MAAARSTGRGVTIAVVDSGVHASHPHVLGVAGGVGFDAAGRRSDDFLDRIGHGTAVTAAIREKAPDASVFAVRIFDRTLSTNVATLCAAIEWAAGAGMRVVNLSLGTTNQAHRDALEAVVRRAVDAGSIIVAARDDEGVSWLPGGLDGVVPVQVDWSCPRETFRIAAHEGRKVLRASGFPRPIPGVPPSRNLSGISFAVANAAGFVARCVESHPDAAAADVLSLLAEEASADDAQ